MASETPATLLSPLALIPFVRSLEGHRAAGTCLAWSDSWEYNHREQDVGLGLVEKPFGEEEAWFGEHVAVALNLPNAATLSYGPSCCDDPNHKIIPLLLHLL